MTPADLAAARELCEGATKGPYIADLDMFDNEIVACISNATTAILFTGGTDCVVPHAQEWTQELQQQSDAAWERAKESQALRDARFLAASRTLVPSLLDLVSQQAARIAELEAYESRVATAFAWIDYWGGNDQSRVDAQEIAAGNYTVDADFNLIGFDGKRIPR